MRPDGYDHLTSALGYLADTYPKATSVDAEHNQWKPIRHAMRIMEACRTLAWMCPETLNATED
jgi:hypothetical protein